MKHKILSGITDEWKEFYAAGYLLLDTIDKMRLLQPSSNVQISKKSL